MYNLQYSIELDIDIIHSSGLPVDETRLQYIISAISEMDDIHVKPNDSGLRPQESSNKSQHSRSGAQYSNDRPQKKNITAPGQRDVGSLEASSSKKAVEVSF